MEEDLERAIEELKELWVFGYGSILWNQGFNSDDQLVGYVEGYVRRFWQGNTTHRGTPRSPGRVATLIEHPEGRVWGIAYHLQGSNQIKMALRHLGIRECILGGYMCQTLTFTERVDLESNDVPRKIPVVTFIATPTNELYLGPTDLDSLASHVIACQGNSGTNVEYVLRIAEFIHVNIPEDTDEHLFTLEKKIKEQLEMVTQIPNQMSQPGYLGGESPVSSFPLNTSLPIVNKDNNNELSLNILKKRMLEQILIASNLTENVTLYQQVNFKTNMTSLQAEKIAVTA